MKVLNYRVQKNDNIESICKFFNIDNKQVISNTKLTEGEVVRISLKQKCIVLPNENINDIAKKLMTTPAEIRQHFGEVFFIGEVLEL